MKRTTAIKYFSEQHFNNVIFIDTNIIDYKTILKELAAVKVLFAKTIVNILGNIIIFR